MRKPNNLTIRISGIPVKLEANPKFLFENIGTGSLFALNITVSIHRDYDETLSDEQREALITLVQFLKDNITTILSDPNYLKNNSIRELYDYSFSDEVGLTRANTEEIISFVSYKRALLFIKNIKEEMMHSIYN